MIPRLCVLRMQNYRQLSCQSITHLQRWGPGEYRQMVRADRTWFRKEQFDKLVVEESDTLHDARAQWQSYFRNRHLTQGNSSERIDCFLFYTPRPNPPLHSFLQVIRTWFWTAQGSYDRSKWHWETESDRNSKYWPIFISWCTDRTFSAVDPPG
jgi:hypothetical protein